MIFIFLLALILFGPKKLPEIGREIGKFMAEFKRASNDFKAQVQNEMEKSGVDMSAMTGGGQQSSSFAQTLLPPAVKETMAEIDEAQERLRRAARMAFEAQAFTLRPPENPTVAATPALPAEAVPAAAAQAGGPAPAAEAVAPAAPAAEPLIAAAASAPATTAHTPEASSPSATGAGDSAPQSS